MVIFLLFIISCHEPGDQKPDEQILARIGNKTISVNEFIRRAEYTIRPVYCNKDNYIHRKIILNSLIAEKLLALEAEDNNPLAHNRYFQDYLRGRKEQAMRQWLFYKDFYSQVKVNPEKVQKRVRLAGRIYDISYFSVSDKQLADRITQTLHDSTDFKKTFKKISSNDKIPRRKVQWSNVESGSVINALYSGSPHTGDVFGPLQEEDIFTFIKINSWTERVQLSEKVQRQQQEDVKNQLQRGIAEKKYYQFVQNLMKGKKLQFNPEIFKALVPLLAERYLKSSDGKEEAFNKRFWDDEPLHQNLEENAATLEEIRSQPLLTIGDKIWTVQKFEIELISHPLVFRKRNIKKSEFAEQLKLAIADLIRDKYITREAYKKGYDQATVVERNLNMWRDNLIALYQRNQWLESNGKKEAFKKSALKVVENNLNPYIHTLQQKYGNQITIVTDTFENIKLSRIDSFMFQKNVPFPIIVPSFPILTTYNKLDYGSKIVN
ncbi:MAG: hypothetical protein R6V04_01795 [bacterium]